MSFLIIRCLLISLCFIENYRRDKKEKGAKSEKTCDQNNLSKIRFNAKTNFYLIVILPSYLFMLIHIKSIRN